ncbi:hypothetical protein D3C75_1248430 [compost metagenome]
MFFTKCYGNVTEITEGDAYGGAVIFRSPERYSIPHLSVNGERARCLTPDLWVTLGQFIPGLRSKPKPARLLTLAFEFSF